MNFKVDSESKHPIKMWTMGVDVEDEALYQLRQVANLPFIHKHVAVMPDVHAGRGATIGSVIATKGAIVPAAVGVDIGCFTGDTKIKLADNRSITFEEMIIEQEQGKKHFVFCIDSKKNIRISDAINARITRSTNHLVEVQLDNGEIITCTPDHKFLSRDGLYVEARDLKVDDSLMPYYEDFSSSNNNNLIEGKGDKELEGYHIVYNPLTGDWRYSHVLADDYNARKKLARIPKEKKWCRHHVDFDKLNNNPDNILRVGRKEHWQIHADSVSISNEKKITGWGRGWQIHGEKWAKMSSEKLKKLHQREDYAEARNKRASEQITRLNSNPTPNMLQHREKIKNLGSERFSWSNQNENCKKYRILMKIRKAVSYLNSIGVNIDCEEEWDQNRNKKIVYNFPRWTTAKKRCDEVGIKLIDLLDNKIVQDLQENYSYKNHKVLGIRNIHLEKEVSVYCLTVPEYGNFALASGVFVKNCGMDAVKTTLRASDLPDSLGHVRTAIEKAVPHGRTDNGGRNDRGAFGTLPEGHSKRWTELAGRYDAIIAKHPKVKSYNNWNHLGTLGTGNHFIEICLDENDDVWAMLHSGSRGPGNRIGQYFIEKAKKEMEKYFVSQYLPDKDLAYLVEHTDLFDDYVEAVGWAQDYAYANRKAMMEATLQAMAKSLPAFDITDMAVSCHHNYVERENHFGSNVLVTRKGAVRAREGDLGIIPGSMGTGSFIVRGKGNKESFCSCSHGAGRKMSRTKARNIITVDEHIAAMKGIEARLDAGVLDESPAAYKDISAVIAAQDDLVEVVHRLRQVVNIKG